jgi:hypothetical protein
MSEKRNLAIFLIEVGVIALVYSNFSYIKQTEEINVAPIEKSVKEKQTLQIPFWVGGGAITLGGLLFIYANRRK